MDGFYAMYYTGAAGFGHAVFVLSDGILSGADATGGILNGTYSITTSGSVDVDAHLSVPAGTTLVTGQNIPNDFVMDINTSLPRDFADGRVVSVTTSMGPVNVVFKMLRALP
ncbi:hypothetical protein [Albimonas pacifica]|uniref:hypothetical protein n=1 Tax=Albimonas pacifica TaxID=1114924 RepID=UPI0011604428|nr:hypothetical protein [Albimonas pacifica]